MRHIIITHFIAVCLIISSCSYVYSGPIGDLFNRITGADNYHNGPRDIERKNRELERIKEERQKQIDAENLQRYEKINQQEDAANKLEEEKEAIRIADQKKRDEEIKLEEAKRLSEEENRKIAKKELDKATKTNEEIMSGFKKCETKDGTILITTANANIKYDDDGKCEKVVDKIGSNSDVDVVIDLSFKWKRNGEEPSDIITGVFIDGVTNLPDDSKLLALVTSESPVYNWKKWITVKNSKFIIGPMNKKPDSKGNSAKSNWPPDIESLTLTLSFTPKGQSKKVKAVVGKKGETLKGDLVKKVGDIYYVEHKMDIGINEHGNIKSLSNIELQAKASGIIPKPKINARIPYTKKDTALDREIIKLETLLNNDRYVGIKKVVANCSSGIDHVNRQYIKCFMYFPGSRKIGYFEDVRDLKEKKMLMLRLISDYTAIGKYSLQLTCSYPNSDMALYTYMWDYHFMRLYKLFGPDL